MKTARNITFWLLHCSIFLWLDQIKAIKKVKLAKILCENMALQRIQPNVMKIPMAERCVYV